MIICPTLLKNSYRVSRLLVNFLWKYYSNLIRLVILITHEPVAQKPANNKIINAFKNVSKRCILNITFQALTINKKTVNIARLVYLIVFHTIMHRADYLTCIKHFYCTILIHTLKIKAHRG